MREDAVNGVTTAQHLKHQHHVAGGREHQHHVAVGRLPMIAKYERKWEEYNTRKTCSVLLHVLVPWHKARDQHGLALVEDQRRTRLQIHRRLELAGCLRSGDIPEPDLKIKSGGLQDYRKNCYGSQADVCPWSPSFRSVLMMVCVDCFDVEDLVVISLQVLVMGFKALLRCW